MVLLLWLSHFKSCHKQVFQKLVLATKLIKLLKHDAFSMFKISTKLNSSLFNLLRITTSPDLICFTNWWHLLTFSHICIETKIPNLRITGHRHIASYVVRNLFLDPTCNRPGISFAIVITQWKTWNKNLVNVIFETYKVT